MQDHDAATTFTLKYLQLLERHLNISWNAAGLPVCIVDWIRDESVLRLQADLAALFQSDLEHAARAATAEFGEKHIQSVGFGLAPDFGQFVQLGLIYGERVVLWDVIHSRVFSNASNLQDRKGLLAQIACSLVTLKAVAERGGAVILSHPVVWSKLAAGIEAELRALGPVSADSLGLSMAFAAIEEGLPLHPYTLLAHDAKTPPASAPSVIGWNAMLFSTENYRFQQCISTVLRDARVAYLEGVRVEDFFDVVSKHGKVRRDLRKHFSPALSGFSPQQAATEMRDLVNDLFELFEKRNKAIVDYAAEGVDATAKFAIATVSSAALGLPLIGALAALGAPAVHLSTTVRKWNKMPERNVIVQTFRALEEVAEPVQHYDPIDAEYQLAELHRYQSSIGALYAKFMAFDWTESRHEFLKALPLKSALELLNLLSADDLEVIVNYRQFQNDYIGDYLVYLSELDDAIYWEHLGKTFESSEGFLIYDGHEHIESMETRDMPLKAWHQLLNSLFEGYGRELRSRDYDYPLERFPVVVRFQTDKARHVKEKRLALVALASTLDREDLEALNDFVKAAYQGESPGWFALPDSTSAVQAGRAEM